MPAEPRAPSSKRRPRAERAEMPALDAGDQALFERLRTRRAAIAKERGVPAYVVAHDRTLADMAQKQPRTREALLSVHGMGPARVEQYGERFLDVLVEGAPP